MTPTALIMMIVAMALLWGGLVASIVNLLRTSDEASED